MKLFFSPVLSLSLLLSQTVVPVISGSSSEPDNYDLTKSTFSALDFKTNSPRITRRYNQYVKQGYSNYRLENEEPFEEIQSFENEPDLVVVASDNDGTSLNTILYDNANDKFMMVAVDENASNFLISVEDQDYLVEENGEDIVLISEDDEVLPIVETYYDPYYAEHDFDWIVHPTEADDSSTYATWVQTASGQYYNSQNLQVQIMSIVGAVVTTGVMAATLKIPGLVTSILGYVGLGWNVGQIFTQQYLVYYSQWYHSSCMIYYKTKYDYYVIPTSANGSTVTATLDMYRYQYTLNANPNSGACTGFTNHTEGPYSYH